MQLEAFPFQFKWPTLHFLFSFKYSLGNRRELSKVTVGERKKIIRDQQNLIYQFRFYSQISKILSSLMFELEVEGVLIFSIHIYYVIVR